MNNNCGSKGFFERNSNNFHTLLPQSPKKQRGTFRSIAIPEKKTDTDTKTSLTPTFSSILNINNPPPLFSLTPPAPIVGVKRRHNERNLVQDDFNLNSLAHNSSSSASNSLESSISWRFVLTNAKGEKQSSKKEIRDKLRGLFNLETKIGSNSNMGVICSKQDEIKTYSSYSLDKEQHINPSNSDENGVGKKEVEKHANDIDIKMDENEISKDMHEEVPQMQTNDITQKEYESNINKDINMLSISQELNNDPKESNELDSFNENISKKVDFSDKVVENESNVKNHVNPHIVVTDHSFENMAEKKINNKRMMKNLMIKVNMDQEGVISKDDVDVPPSSPFGVGHLFRVRSTEQIDPDTSSSSSDEGEESGSPPSPMMNLGSSYSCPATFESDDEGDEESFYGTKVVGPPQMKNISRIQSMPPLNEKDYIEDPSDDSLPKLTQGNNVDIDLEGKHNRLRNNSLQIPEFRSRALSVSPILEPRNHVRSRSMSVAPLLMLPESTVETGFADVAREPFYGGKTRVNQYIIWKRIGKGAYGKVKLVRNHRDGKLYAMKIMNKRMLQKSAFGIAMNSVKWENVKREVAIMKKLKHPNIVKLFEVIDDVKNDNLFLIMEYLERGPLMKGLECEPFENEVIRKYFRELLIGLEYLHFQNVVHRDIKPENLLVGKDGRVKIADFGVSAVLKEGENLRNTEGSSAFMAPEICSGETNFKGPPTDIWSSGITLFMLAYGTCPYLSDTAYELYNVIVNDELVFPDEPNVDPKLKDLISKMLDKNPETRITLGKIKEHDWVTNNGSEPMRELDGKEHEKVEVSKEEISNAFVFVAKKKTKTISINVREKMRIDQMNKSDKSLQFNVSEKLIQRSTSDNFTE